MIALCALIIIGNALLHYVWIHVNFARCQKINRLITHSLFWPQFVSSSITHRIQLHIWMCGCVCVCAYVCVYGIHDFPSVHPGGARDFRCMLPPDTEISGTAYQVKKKKKCCTWVKQRTQKRRISNTAAKVFTTFNNNSNNNNYSSITLYALFTASLIYVCLSLTCALWSIHSFIYRTLGRQPDVHFSTNLASLCVCAARELRLLLPAVHVCVCLWFQLLWLFDISINVCVY